MSRRIYSNHQKVNKGQATAILSNRNSKRQLMRSLHKSQEWNKVLGKRIVRPTWKVYLSFKEVVTENLHDVDHISLCVCSMIRMKRQNLESSRKIFMEIFKLG